MCCQIIYREEASLNDNIIEKKGVFVHSSIADVVE